jgi:thioredoxin reductase (NADPH)
MYKVFSKDNCVYCTKAKTLLNNLKLPYEEHKLSPTFTPDKMFEMIGKQVRSMPQIMHNDTLIGGYTDLREHLINEGKINFEGNPTD